MNSNSTKKFRVLVEVILSEDDSIERISYRSSFSSCCAFVSLFQRNLYPNHCRVRFFIQRLDELSDSYITISYTSYMNSDLPF